MHCVLALQESLETVAVQEYVRELAICLATGGHSLRWDLDSAAGRRLAQLHDELCCLCTTKATSGLEAHRTFIKSPILPIAQSQNAADSSPNWLELGVSAILTIAASMCTCKLWSA